VFKQKSSCCLSLLRGKFSRSQYEICTLSLIRGTLTVGNVCSYRSRTRRRTVETSNSFASAKPQYVKQPKELRNSFGIALKESSRSMCTTADAACQLLRSRLERLHDMHRALQHHVHAEHGELTQTQAKSCGMIRRAQHSTDWEWRNISPGPLQMDTKISSTAIICSRSVPERGCLNFCTKGKCTYRLLTCSACQQCAPGTKWSEG
jgi:hypothetical protein